MITVQIYLNEGFEGGATTFFDDFEANPLPVVPKTGMLFKNNLFYSLTYVI